MAGFASRLLRTIRPGNGGDRVWTIPPGRRVYAVGDIHGHLDLLDRLLASIEADDAARPPMRATLLFLGDLVDRGPDSRGVIDRLMRLPESGTECVFLSGNHDEVFARAAGGEREAMARLHRMGGRETALSYGITAEEYDRGSFEDLAALLHSRVPAEHVAFLRTLADSHQVGDYFFVHAGVRPRTPLRDQKPEHLRWIRDEFLSSRACHGAMVVHGHTVSEEVEMLPNRIGIDTGAFRTGRLTAIGLEGADRWLLTT
jgi:serine/threonine protein phosphatase 1